MQQQHTHLKVVNLKEIITVRALSNSIILWVQLKWYIIGKLERWGTYARLLQRQSC